ncbi:MAG: hypothetical protein IJL26_08885, partial [Clostridia bacterium]|nr:hypothetical protein [Clostridia bacterium]
PRRRALHSTGYEHFCKTVFSLEKIKKMKDGCCRFFVSATAPFCIFKQILNLHIFQEFICRLSYNNINNYLS